MDLRQLRQFLALAETQNFHRAAEMLHIAQPPLSVSIRKLEEELGVRLVERHPRGVTLTAEGALAASQAREILRLSDELRTSAKEAIAGARGPLNVGFVASATYDVIPSLVPVFRARFPAVDLSLREATSIDIIAGLVKGDLDVGLVRTPLFEAEGVKLTPLACETLVLAVPRGHRLESRAEVELAELKNESLVLYDGIAVPALRALIDLQFSAIGITPKVVQEAVQIHTMVALVECGLGVALVPSVLRRAGLGRVRLVDLFCKGTPIQIGFAIAVRDTQTRRLWRNFAEVAAEVLADPSWHPLVPPTSQGEVGMMLQLRSSD
jgi:DNA-binding transcriptional LysR family regulator